jgi:two-component system phosphate regulon sensor histidine kinase PhoR
MRRHSFFTKLLAGNLLLIGIIIGVGGLVSYRRLNETYLAQNEEFQERIVQFAQLHFQEVWRASGGGIELIDRECKRFAVESPMRLTVVAADGRVLGDSEADPRSMEDHNTPDRPEVQAALGGRSGRAVHPSGTLKGVESRYLALPIRHDERVVGVVRVAMPIVAIAESLTFIRNALLWAAVAALAAAVVLALLLSWIWYAPLRQIALTARTLAAGDLSKKATISGSGELAQLGAALNEMRDSINLKIGQVAAQRQNLVSVVENLEDGVIALDTRARIILMNRSAMDLLAAAGQEVTGRYLEAVVRIAEIVDVYNEVVRSGGPISRQVETEIGDRPHVLEVHGERLSEHSAEGLAALLVVRDVTHLVRMAAVKAEFVANASHELRTPLATIRAAVDSLAAVGQGQAEELGRLVEILDRHTTRLEEMTSDLLSLHLVESMRHRLRLEPIELPSLAAWVAESFEQRAAEEGIALKAECAEQAEDLHSDGTLIELVLQNLLDNALKFTPRGGRVVCRFDCGQGRVVITVADTGCGIPPEMQDRVFERFFQADSARSGEPRIRGTGLGLAIVKHAAERLGATVELHSRVGKGTTVAVTIPRRPASGATTA